jgi:hypothetical protein
VQLIHKGMGPRGGRYATVIRQGLSEAPLSSEELIKRIKEVVETAISEPGRSDKAQLNSDTLGSYASPGQVATTVHRYIGYIREYCISANREQSLLSRQANLTRGWRGMARGAWDRSLTAFNQNSSQALGLLEKVH